jgi:hypothetical protein
VSVLWLQCHRAKDAKKIISETAWFLNKERRSKKQSSAFLHS